MKISEKKKEKILSQIVDFLYINFPKPLFTSFIAQEIARDEEFVKKLLIELKNKKLINEIKKNPNGIDYIRRSRWKLSNETYSIYKNKQ
jgi:hypothetical protein